DMNPGEPGSGSIWFEEDPGSGLVYITWLDVESYPNGVANPSTFQMVFHPATGIVTMNVVALDPIGGATTGDRWLVGYSPGGASADPGRTDLAALATGPGQTVFLPPAEIAALELRASGRPLLGSTVVLTTGNQTGGGFGFALLATAPAQPALDLATMGAPGCSAWVDPASSATVLLSNLGAPGLGMNVALPIPNDTGLLGVHIYGQSAWLDSTANALGVITSNGVRLELGSY
ncbi:MAG: hypothetical protein H6838_20250, partial [Planctomycetes bacterium]|nr:hypothetical protein [Planctomycetota bacterium]